MNSSGIKRGLAASAVAALAVAGLPLLASSASAAAGDVIASATVNKVRNGGQASANIVLKTKNIAASEIELADQALGSDLDPNNSNQTITVGAATIAAEGTANDSVKGDGYDEITVPYSATTPAVGDAVKFALYAETADATSVNADEARINIDTTTVGAPTQVDVSTAQPATVEGQAVTFNVEIKDAAGNRTQLVAGEEFDVTATGGAAIDDNVLADDDLGDGVATFKATPALASPDTMTVTVTGSTPPAATVTDSATVSVFDNAAISADEFALTTGADTWKDGVTTFGTATQVRVDQNTVTFEFASKDGVDADTTPDDAGKVVGLAISSADLKVNDKAATPAPVVVPVVLDANGKGSVTITLSDVVDGDSFTFSAPGSGIGATTVTMKRAAATTVASDAGVYVTKVGQPTAVTVTVKDQFGNAIGAPAQVSIVRGARNGGTETARVTVGSDGKATINLPDAGTTAGTEAFSINLYSDQFDGTPEAGSPFAGGTINYTTDGLGGDFNVGGATSDATATVISPLWDDNAGAGVVGDDFVTLNIGNVNAGTANAPVKVTVDNGALILTGAESNVSQGSASETITLDGAGAGSVTVVGTKTGVVTATIESAGRTKTVKFTVAQQVAAEAIAAARNVEVTAPEKAKAGEVAVFDVKVTDAFGNAIAGVTNLNAIVSGPGNFQSADPATGNDGVWHVNVLLTDNANSPVSLRVIGFGSQFGSKANEINGAPAPGLSASTNDDSDAIEDVVNIAELQKAVDDAQEKVDNRQDALDLAQGNLSVAQAEKQVAQSNVKAAKKDLKQAKKKNKGVRAAKAALREAQGELKVAKAKVSSAKAAVATAEQRLAAAQAELEAAQQELEDAQN